METEQKAKKTRTQYTDEFKAGAVRLVLEEGRAAAAVAKSLGLKSNSVQKWVQRARIDRGDGRPDQLTSVEKEELAKLRKENRELRMERELLKKWAAFFAKESA
jgi:transposase